MGPRDCGRVLGLGAGLLRFDVTEPSVRPLLAFLGLSVGVVAAVAVLVDATENPLRW